MARVVQKRSGPPYLLIVFVMLFLIATVMAVLFYLNFDEQRALAAEEQQLREHLASDREIEQGRIAELLQQRQDRTLGSTVLGHMFYQMQELANLVHPAADEPEQADAQAQRAYEAAGERGGLAPLVISLKERVDSRDETIESLRASLEEREGSLEERIEALQDIEAQYEQSLEDARGQLAELEQRIGSLQEDQESQLEESEQRLVSVRTDMQAQIAERVETIEDLQGTIGEMEAMVEGLRSRLERQVGIDARPLRPDGKVERVLEAENIVYINLGSRDDIRPGFTFSVYDDERVPALDEEAEPARGKGSLVVTKVGERISECRIVEQVEDDPIVEGDVVANIIFDGIRELEFVVVGRFDLFGTDDPTEEGREQVKQLIRRMDGRIADEVTVRTNYVIVGHAPQRPTQPPEAAPPSVWEVYNRQLERYRRFQEIQATARGMMIPILDTGRFLAFTGYIPDAP